MSKEQPTNDPSKHFTWYMVQDLEQDLEQGGKINPTHLLVIKSLSDTIAELYNSSEWEPYLHHLRMLIWMYNKAKINKSL